MAIVPPQDFPFCGPSNLSATPVLDAQRSINLYPDPGIASSKSPMALVGRPGLSAFSSVGSGDGHSLWAGEGRLFAARGGHVYEMTNFGTILQDYGLGLNVGTPSPAPMFSSGEQLLICDPVFEKILYIDPVSFVMTQVLTGVALEFLDGFHVAIASGASLAGSNPNQIQASNFLDAGTAGSWTNFVLRTGTPDLTVQLAVVNNLLWIFGRKSLEAWYNAGLPNFPFARVSGSTIGVGCLAAYSVVKFYNTVVWLGQDDHGYGQVYMLRGMSPVRVSNSAIERVIAGYALGLTLSFAKAHAEVSNGHSFYCLQLCNAFYQCNVELVYDLTTGLWHERSYGASFSGRYLAAAVTVNNFSAASPNFAMNEMGDIQYQDESYTSDAGTAITYTRTAPHLTKDNKWHRYNRFELDCDIGTAAPLLDYSNDGGRSFLGLSTPLAQNANAGTQGAFQRFYTQQIGRSEDRVFKVTITDSANKIRLVNALLDVD